VVNEPSVEETILILLRFALSLTAPQAQSRTLLPHRGCSLALNRFISDRFRLYDKAIDLIDEAGSRRPIINSKLSSATFEQNLRQVLNQKKR